MALPNRQKTAGDQTEREAERILAAHLGVAVRRKLGAGRRDDMGDIDLHDTTIQVTRVLDQRTLASRARAKAVACMAQQERAGTSHGATLIRASTLVGVVWRVVLTGEQWGALRVGSCELPPDGWPAWLTIAALPDIDRPRSRPVWVQGLAVTTVRHWAEAWREAT